MSTGMILDRLNIQESKKTISWALRLFLMALLLVGAVGCAGTSKTQELLATEYMTMSDDDLLLYYYQLEDQIVADERVYSGSSVSVGVGRSRYSGGGSHRRGGVGMSTGVGGTQIMATDLREQRNQVRVELQRRGITP